MRMTINLSGLLEEIDQEISAIPYLIKLYLKEKVGIPILIDPLNPFDTSFEVIGGTFTHEYLVDETEFSITVEYEPQESLI